MGSSTCLLGASRENDELQTLDRYKILKISIILFVNFDFKKLTLPHKRCSCSRLGTKLRAHARARSCLGFQCSYLLGDRDFGA